MNKGTTINASRLNGHFVNAKDICMAANFCSSLILRNNIKQDLDVICTS